MKAAERYLRQFSKWKTKQIKTTKTKQKMTLQMIFDKNVFFTYSYFIDKTFSNDIEIAPECSRNTNNMY